ncbi:hypothetical protein [Aquimarina algiphila]|uniref:hypothetical protein n=1 Tax=Aquimarina algiphila TaxID=2047982 RepID=UPI002490D853|nr:hypothetical protein [Aquimarina algiphila]
MKKRKIGLKKINITKLGISMQYVNGGNDLERASRLGNDCSGGGCVSDIKPCVGTAFKRIDDY